MYMSPRICGTATAAPWSNVAGKSAHEQNLCAHEALFFEGDEANYLYEVVEGVMSNHQILPDGRRQVISFAYPGDLIGLGHTKDYHFNCEAVCRARVRSISKAALMRGAAEHADVGRHLLEAVTAELTSMQEHQLVLGRKSAIEKLATFLLGLVRRQIGDFDPTPVIQLPMTRTDIADFLGMTIETVSRNMSKLRMMGAIDLPQTTTVMVRNMKLLEALADGDDGAC